MKPCILLLFGVVLITGCGKSSSNGDEHDESGIDTTNTNQALYDQLMDIHDEVMPKMQDIYTLKKKLQDQIAATPDMVVEKKQELQKRIAALDSASEMMMDWMHKFAPWPDSTDQEVAREYLESEMEKIKKVREAMLEAIKKEQGSN